MARFDLALLGDKALSEALASLPEHLEKKVLTRAMKQATQVLQAITSPRIPRSSVRRRPGSHVADTLHVRQLRRKKGRIGYALVAGKRDELGITAKDPWYYPAVLEFGTRTRPPHPAWRTALHQGHEALLAVIRQELSNGIERELRKAGA